MSLGNYFFKLNTNWNDDYYSFKADTWYCASGDFMDRPTLDDLRSYFQESLMTVEWKEIPDVYGETYDRIGKRNHI